MWREWVKRNHRLLTLKVAVACALVYTHYYPSDANWVVNLIWLFLF